MCYGTATGTHAGHVVEGSRNAGVEELRSAQPELSGAKVDAEQARGYVARSAASRPEMARIQARAGVAQLVEHQLPKLRVASSSLVARLGSKPERGT